MCCCLVRGRSLGMGRQHSMRWSSVTLSAILSKVVSRGLLKWLQVCLIVITVSYLSTAMLPIAQ